MKAYALVIFDMDGTLTEELLDFEAIRRDVGTPEGVGILEHIASRPEGERPRVEAILHRHEYAGAQRCGLHDGAADLLGTLKAYGIYTALLTRNSAACTSLILSRHKLALDYVATRENPPHKPHADSILNITRRFQVTPQQTLMVGDYIYDLQAAQAAGTDSALLCLRDNGKRPPFAHLATYCIDSLHDILPLLEKPST